MNPFRLVVSIGNFYVSLGICLAFTLGHQHIATVLYNDTHSFIIWMIASSFGGATFLIIIQDKIKRRLKLIIITVECILNLTSLLDNEQVIQLFTPFVFSGFMGLVSLVFGYALADMYDKTEKAAPQNEELNEAVKALEQANKTKRKAEEDSQKYQLLYRKESLSKEIRAAKQGQQKEKAENLEAELLEINKTIEQYGIVP